jgi:hypothetical protein
LAAAVVPVLVWHDLMAKLYAGFRFDPAYLLTAWSGFALMAFGLIAIVPVVWSAGGNPASRFYPRRRDSLAGWGTSFYILGLALVVQVAAIAANS